MPCRLKRAVRFTLVELLVVIAIIILLIAVLLPALRGAKEAGNRLACAGKLRQINTAILCYAHDWNEYFPPMEHSTSVNYRWFVKIDQYLGFNIKKLSSTHPIMRCPSQRQDPATVYSGWYDTDYGFSNRLCNLSGSPETIDHSRFVKLFQVRYPTTTISLSDMPGGVVCDLQPSKYTTYSTNMWRHNGGINFLFIDGHKEWMDRNEFYRRRYNIANNWNYGWRDGLIY